MLLQPFPILSVAPFWPLLIITFLELLILCNLNPQIEEIREISTLKMIAGLEAEDVKSYFCEFGLRHHYEAMVSCRLKIIEIFLYHFVGILLI